MTMVPLCCLNQVIEHQAKQDYPGPCTLDDYGYCVMSKTSDYTPPKEQDYQGPCTLGDVMS